MSDDESKPQGSAPPPKIDLRKTGLVVPPPAGAAAAGETLPAAKQQTARVEVPPEGTAKKQTSRVEVPPETAAKKQTSRIALDAILASAAPSSASKTIRIKRPTIPSAPAEPAAEGSSVAGEEAVKRQTSRIPLEAALSASAGGEEGARPEETVTTPKTIRIKRPTQAATIKLVRPESGADGSAEAAKSQTSRIDMPVGEPETAAAPTQRKTIKIRRPEGGAARVAKTMTIARPEGGAAGPGVAVGATPEGVPERGGGAVFSIAALAAVLVACVVVYVLAAQAFPGLGLSMPGRATI